MSFNGNLRTPSSTPSAASSWVARVAEKLIPSTSKKKNASSNDTQGYEELRDLSLNLGGDVAKHRSSKHRSADRPKTEEAKNASKVINQPIRQRLNEGHKNVRKKEPSKV